MRILSPRFVNRVVRTRPVEMRPIQYNRFSWVECLLSTTWMPWGSKNDSTASVKLTLCFRMFWIPFRGPIQIPPGGAYHIGRPPYRLRARAAPCAAHQPTHFLGGNGRRIKQSPQLP